jgi:hypothetical protein
MAVADTSMRVSKETLAEFSRFQQAIGAKSADEALHTLLRMKRRELLRAVYGSARGEVNRFTEADRLDADH